MLAGTLGLQGRIVGCLAVITLVFLLVAASLTWRAGLGYGWLAVTLVLGLAIGAASIWYAVVLLRPARRLRDIARKVLAGDFQVCAAVESGDEFEDIGKGLDAALKRYRSREGEFSAVHNQKDSLDDLTRVLSGLAGRLAGGDLNPAHAQSLDAPVRAIAEDLNRAASRFAATVRAVIRFATNLAELSASVKMRTDRIVALARGQREEVEWEEMELSAGNSAMNEGIDLATQCEHTATVATEALRNARPVAAELAESSQRLRELAAGEGETLKRLKTRLEELSGVVGMVGQAARQAQDLTARARAYRDTAGRAGKELLALAEQARRVAEHVNETVAYIGRVAEGVRGEAESAVGLFDEVACSVESTASLAQIGHREIEAAQIAAAGWVELSRRLVAAIDLQAQVSRRLESHEGTFLKSLKTTGSHLLTLSADAEKLLDQAMALGETVSVYRLPEPGPAADEEGTRSG